MKSVLVIMNKVFLFLLFLSAPFTVQAQQFPDKPAGYVNDYAGMISPRTREMLEQAMQKFRDSTSNVVVIATFEDLQGFTPEEFGTALFNKWRMWEGDRYNGVLILAGKNDRKLRIEVGYGLEGAIPDVIAGRIIKDEMAPRFRNGDFDAGFASAVIAVMQASKGEYKGTGKSNRKAKKGEDSVGTIFVMGGIFFFLVIVPLFRTMGGKKGRAFRKSGAVDVSPWIIASILSDISRHNRGGGGGFGGGGGGGFGGFSGGGGFGSGGGGASGGW